MMISFTHLGGFQAVHFRGSWRLDPKMLTKISNLLGKQTFYKLYFSFFFSYGLRLLELLRV